jgi:hypothetical protein
MILTRIPGKIPRTCIVPTKFESLRMFIPTAIKRNRRQPFEDYVKHTRHPSEIDTNSNVDIFGLTKVEGLKGTCSEQTVPVRTQRPQQVAKGETMQR